MEKTVLKGVLSRLACQQRASLATVVVKKDLHVTDDGFRRRPRASAGTHADTRELAAIDKQKTQPIRVGFRVLVEAGGIEPPSARLPQLDLHT